MLSAALHQQISHQKVLPVLVLDNNEQARVLADCLLEFQLNAIEITLRTPEALNVIEFLATNYPELIVGAGTITSADQLQAVQQSGAQFALSPGATGFLGTRYAVPFILFPSCSLFRTESFVNHFPQVDAGQPPQTNLNGKPFIGGIGFPFIAQATRVSSSIAFLIGTPLDITTLVGSPDRCVSAP